MKYNNCRNREKIWLLIKNSALVNFFMMIDFLIKRFINCYLYEMYFIIKWYNVISIYNFII